MKPFNVGMDSYALQPLALSPFEMLEWVKGRGGDGVQFSEVNLKEEQRMDGSFLNDLAQAARDLGLYIEWGGGQHIPFNTTTWEPLDLFPVNRRAAEQAFTLGAKSVRSCSGGLMRWKDEAPPTEVLLQKMAESLKRQKRLFDDLGVVLAIEIHFEFTTFELLRVFEKCNAEPGGGLGICLDTMNLLTMLEDPVEGTERVLPWVVSTHLKDGGLLLNREGLASFTAPVGTGLVDLKRILSLLSTLERSVNLSIEDHGGSFEMPIFDPLFLSRFPDLTARELSRLIALALEGNRRIEAGTLTPLTREEWPGLCETRVAGDIARLKRMVQEGSGSP